MKINSKCTKNRKKKPVIEGIQLMIKHFPFTNSNILIQSLYEYAKILEINWNEHFASFYFILFLRFHLFLGNRQPKFPIAHVGWLTLDSGIKIMALNWVKNKTRNATFKYGTNQWKSNTTIFHFEKDRNRTQSCCVLNFCGKKNKPTLENFLSYPRL